MLAIANGGTAGPVGSLCADAPAWVRHPPIEAVVFAWGVNEDGQLGLDTAENVTSPKVVEALLGVQFMGRDFQRSPLVAGSRNTIAIDVDGQVWSWGWNDRGTLGHGHRSPERKPKRIAALKGVRIVQAAIGGWHCLALSDSGQVYAWGGNEYLQCGVEPELRDIVYPTLCVSELRVKQVACGGMHSLAVTESGEVWMWGEPWGDFGMVLRREPTKVETAKNIETVCCGAFHNIAVDHAGAVYTWGTNDYGQLGNGSTCYQTIPKKVVDLDNVQIADVAAGGWHSCALSTQGHVYVWGRGEYGRLGLGDPLGSSKLRPVKLRSLESFKIVQIGAGGTHTMALTVAGRVFIWGRGSFGRLGLGVEKDHNEPVEVVLPGGSNRWKVISLSVGGRHTFCLALPVQDRSASGSEDDAEYSELVGTSEEADDEADEEIETNGREPVLPGDLPAITTARSSADSAVEATNNLPTEYSGNLTSQDFDTEDEDEENQGTLLEERLSTSPLHLDSLSLTSPEMTRAASGTSNYAKLL